MRARQVFEYALVEINKRKAPSLILEDYNYFINKAINQYVNRMYNAYEINQQKTDDIRVLKSSAVLVPNISEEYSSSSLLNNSYEVNLPDDYLHILNCIVEYDVIQTNKCYVAGSKYQQGAKRVTSDMLPQILHNHYLRPSYKNPYYYINNVTISNEYPTTDSSQPIIANINTAVPFDEADIHAVEDLVYYQENVPSTVRHYYKALMPITTVTSLGIFLPDGETKQIYFSTAH